MKKFAFFLVPLMAVSFLTNCGGKTDPTPPGPKQYTVSVTSEDTSKGTVSGGGSYAYNSDVTITATANTGYKFAGWYDSGTHISDEPTYNFKMPANDIAYTARFAANQYTVSVTSEDTSKGTVSGGGSYAYGTQVTISATPKVNATITNYFVGWYDENDDLVSKEKEYVIDNISHNITLKGRFKSYSPNADFGFGDAGSNTLKITSYSGKNNVVLVPDKILHNGSLKNVVAIEKNAFKDCSSLTSVTIPYGVTSIGIGAFTGCSSLESIDIPDGITVIDSGTFLNCSSLTSIIIPNSVTNINARVFENCFNLTSIIIPSNVSLMMGGVFTNCSSLTSIIIPIKVKTMGSSVFDGCSSMSDIYCEVSSKPNLWRDDWRGNCKATIHWGYKPGNNINS